MENLKVCGLNLNISWENKYENFQEIEKQFENNETDLLILPEMFSTGFVMEPEKIADRNLETLTWMQKFAKEKQIAICGSAAVSEKGKFYNRFYFVKPDGTFQFYDKRHLFSYSGENLKYTAGKERVIVRYKGWKILLQVCYDLRFPVFSRNNDDYDAIIYVANWPETRIDVWKTLLKARSIENQAYVFGLNRIGKDGNNLYYPESSYCYFPDGNVLSSLQNNLVSSEFNGEKLKEFKQRFRFLNDRDDFQIL